MYHFEPVLGGASAILDVPRSTLEERKSGPGARGVRIWNVKRGTWNLERVKARMTSVEPLLRTIEASKTYQSEGGSVRAVKRASLEIYPGEFLAVTGPSGCGKSTLLHLLGGMDRSSEGEVWYGDLPLHQMSETQLTRFRRREVGFVFQFFYLLPTLTVLENVELPLELVGGSSSRRRALDLLELVGLSRRSASFPGQLSGGEMQRAAVARALVAGPRLLLADEPTGNLDTDNGEIVLHKMQELAGRTDTAVVIATHSGGAASFADRTIGMRDGQLVSSE